MRGSQEAIAVATFLRPSFNVVDPGDCPSVGTGAVTLVPSLSSNGESRCLCPSPSGCSGDRRGAGPLAVIPPQTPSPPETDLLWPSLQLGRMAHRTRLFMPMVGEHGPDVGRSQGCEQHAHAGTREVKCFGEGSCHLLRKAHLPLVHHQC